MRHRGRSCGNCRRGARSETRHYHRATASDSERTKRYGSSARHAGSETEAVRQLRSAEDGVRPTAVEMTGYGRRGKPNPGFPRRPQPLEIAARFPHSHRRDEARKSGKRKARFPLSRLLFVYRKRTQKGGPAAGRFAPAFRLIVRLSVVGCQVSVVRCGRGGAATTLCGIASVIQSWC